MDWGTPVQWGWFLLFSRSRGHKTKETYPTRPGSPTPCKQGLRLMNIPYACMLSNWMQEFNHVQKHLDLVLFLYNSSNRKFRRVALISQYKQHKYCIRLNWPLQRHRVVFKLRKQLMSSQNKELRPHISHVYTFTSFHSQGKLARVEYKNLRMLPGP